MTEQSPLERAARVLILRGLCHSDPQQEEVSSIEQAVEVAYWARQDCTWLPVELANEDGQVLMNEADLDEAIKKRQAMLTEAEKSAIAPLDNQEITELEERILPEGPR
jgi:hypothetical protein